MNDVDKTGVMEVIAPVYKSPLEDRKVKIRPVPVKRNQLIVGSDRERMHSEGVMLTGSSKSIILKLNSSGRLINPFKSLEQRKWFEQELGKKLDPNILVDNYLTQIRITVTKSDEDLERCFTELDLSVADDYLKYLICLVSNEVATTKKPMYTQDEIFFIDDEVVTVESETSDNKIEDTCLEYLFSIKENRNKLIQMLRTYTILHKKSTQIDRATKTEIIYNFLKELVRDRTTRKKVYDLVTRIKEDPQWYQTINFVQEAIEIGEIKYYDGLNEFKLVDGMIIGKSYNDVLEYFKTPESQAIKARIKDQIKNQLK